MQKVNPRSKSQKGYKIYAVVLSLILIALSLFTVFEIYSMGILTPMLMTMVIIIVLLIDAILALLLIFNARKAISRVIFSILTVIVAFVFGLGGFYMMQANSLLSNITNTEGKIKNTVSVIVMDKSSYEELEDINGETVGTLKTIDQEGTKKSLSDIKAKSVSVEDKKYDSVQDEVKALYDGDVKAILLNESYRDSVQEIEAYQKFNDETRVLFKTEYYTDKVENKAKAVDDITSHPFNILISGSDSRGTLAEVARSDVNMIVTVNPETGVILLTSIPRDYYVTTECDAAYGCQVGALDKLTHTGIHGVETTQATLENLLGVDINYTFRVNFSSVTGLVDALGGIDVEVAPGYAVDSFWTNPNYGVTEGTNHLNGEGALAYARERYAYQEGDRQRVKNQQQVLMAIIKKAISPSILVNYTSFMQALHGAFETNMSQSEISKLIQHQLDQNPSWTFVQYSLDGTGSTEMCAELGDAAYVMIPDENTIKLAKEKIDAVISGSSAQEIEAMNNQ